jgi:hypothetical protein
VQHQYVCAVPTTVGSGFCCRKLCMCPLDLQPGFNQDPATGKVITPSNCSGASPGMCPTGVAPLKRN